MSKSTFRILFYLRKNYLNKSGKAGIMVRLTVNGDMVQFSSKLDIEPAQWDTKAGKAIGNSVKARQMNSMLDDIRTALNNHYRYVESRDSFVTAEKVRNAFLGYEVRQQTLLELFKRRTCRSRTSPPLTISVTMLSWAGRGFPNKRTIIE